MSARFLTRISFGLSLLLFVMLMALPTSGWLVRRQIGLCLHRPTLFVDTLPDSDRLHHVASQFPTDYSLQIADVLLTSASSNDRPSAFRSLQSRFPNSPSLDAHILCSAVGKEIHISRRDLAPPIPQTSSGFPGAASDSKPTSAPQPTIEKRDLPKDLAEFNLAASKGERLDPDNAFFPIMRAIGLFAADQDARAMQALSRAAAKTHWNDYTSENVRSEWHLEQVAYGHLSAMAHLALANVASEAYSPSLYALARVTTNQAIKLELRGDIKAGIALRHALMRCASLIRADGDSQLEPMFSATMVKSAAWHPGGFIVKPAKSALSIKRYCDYLERHGYQHESQWVQREVLAEQKVNEIFHKAYLLHSLPFSDKQVLELNNDWMAEIVLLSDFVVLLVLLGIALMLKRVPVIRDFKALPVILAWSIAAAMLVVVSLFVMLAMITLFVMLSVITIFVRNYSFLVQGVLIAAWIGIVIGLVKSWIQDRRRILQSIGIFLVSLVCLGALFGLAYWLMDGAMAINSIQFVLFDAPLDDRYSEMLREMNAWHLVLLGFCFVMPIFVLIGLSIACIMRRVPIASGVVHSYCRNFFALAGLLIVVYVGLSVVTLREEAAFNGGIVLTQVNEGRTLAAMIGRPWPEAK